MLFRKLNLDTAGAHRPQSRSFWSSLWVLLGLAALLGLTPAARAQVTSGTIFGSVQDPSGAMVPHAAITATEVNIGVTRTSTSSSAGTFSLPNLPPGTYTVTAAAQGFKSTRKSGLILHAADNLSAGALVLEVGAASATVEVTATAAELQIQADSGERSDLISNKQLNDVAMNGRNVLDYMRLIPGVAGVGTFGANGTGGLSSYNINGTRANSHEFTLDGTSNVDTGDNGGTHVTINPDAISEVKVLSSNYAAEFGKASGGQIAVVSKGGSNEFHGGAHYFHRNDGMNATGWYNNHNNQPKQLFRYNTEGYNVGGPIKRDKLFFFWSNEFYQQLVPGGTNSYYVPTALERQGNFSQSYNSSGTLLKIYQPGTTTQYTNNTLTGINSSMLNIMNLYATPNVSSYGTSTNFSYNRIDNISYDHPRKEFIARVDYQITPSERIYARWIGNRESTVTPMQTGILQCMGNLQITGGCKNTQPSWNLAVNLTSTLNSHLLNEFSMGPSAYRTTWTGNNGNLSVGHNSIDLPLLYTVTSDTSIPDISYSGTGQSFPWSYFGANPWFQANTTINVNDNLSWVKNNHSFKFGVFYQRSRKDQIAWGNYNGQFGFNSCATSGSTLCKAPNSQGSPLASALLGDFSTFDQSSARPRGYFRYNQLEFYAQDTWQVSPQLTLNYGLRFVWIPPQYDDKNQIALFDASSYVKSAGVQIDTDGNIIANSGNMLAGMKFVSDGSLPKGGWDDKGIMVEPRLGFAWDFYGDHKGVLRGGFGMSHDREQGNLVFNPTFTNPKNVTTPSISATSYLPLSSIKTATQNSAGLLSGIIGADRNGQVPTVYSFSLGVQRELGAGFSYDIAYVGTISRHLVTARDLNQIPYGTTFTKAAQNPANFAGNVVPNVEPNLPPEYAAAGYKFSGQYAYPTNYLAPYWGYDQLEYYKFDGTANYNSLQTSLQRRFGKRLTAGAVYTWSKSMTTSSADESYVDPYNPRKYNYQVAGWDRAHVAAVNYVYDMPAFSKFLHAPRLLSYLTDGYQLSGVSSFMTGTPTWTSFWQRGDLLTGGRQWSKLAPMYLGLDAAGKPVIPTIGQPYMGTPDKLRDNAMQTWDMSLFKNFPLGNASRSLQIRCEAFNVFNHTNIASHNYGANLTLPSYSGGTYTAESVTLDSAWKTPTSVWNQAGPGGPRVIQLGAKISF